MAFLLLPIRSSLASKVLMAVTGAGLALFVLAHLAGNLLLFLGPDAINGYAQKLKENPALLWTARLGLLAFFGLHVLMGVRLSLVNAAARGRRYEYEDTRVASWASRYMLLTGILVLLFVLYHLAHFTLGWVHEAKIRGGTLHYLELEQAYSPATGKGLPPGATVTPEGTKPLHRHDVYTMVLVGFRHPAIAAFYLFSMVVLWLHLWHGVSSLWQSLGLGTAQETRWIAWIGPVFATLVLVGNACLVLAVQLRLIGPSEL